MRLLFLCSAFSLNHVTVEARPLSTFKALLALVSTFCSFSQPVVSLEGSRYNVTGTDQYDCAKRVDVTPGNGLIMTGVTYDSSLNQTRVDQGRLISFYADTSVKLSIVFDDIDITRGPFLKTTNENCYVAFNQKNVTSTVVVAKADIDDISDVEPSAAVLEDQDLHLRSTSVDRERDLLALVGHRENNPQDNDMRIFVMNSTLDVQYDIVIHGNATMAPTPAPSKSPTALTHVPPTLFPTQPPSLVPSMSPTLPTTSHPTASPNNDPTSSPRNNPSQNPSVPPTKVPTHTPSTPPTKHPTEIPTVSATQNPTVPPVINPDAYATCSHYTRQKHLLVGGHSNFKGGYDIWLLRLSGTILIHGKEIASVYDDHGMAIIKLHQSDDVYFVGGIHIDGKLKLLVQRLTYWFDEVWSRTSKMSVR